MPNIELRATCSTQGVAGSGPRVQSTLSVPTAYRYVFALTPSPSFTPLTSGPTNVRAVAIKPRGEVQVRVKDASGYLTIAAGGLFLLYNVSNLLLSEINLRNPGASNIDVEVFAAG